VLRIDATQQLAFVKPEADGVISLPRSWLPGRFLSRQDDGEPIEVDDVLNRLRRARVHVLAGWVPLGIAYTLLVAAFGWGVRASARRNRPLRVAGGLLVAYGAIGLAWPPMHLREVLAAGEGTLTDTTHIVLAMVTVLLMLLAMGFGAAAFGKRFRFYSVATIVILAACGTLTTLNAPRIGANLPTPWVGVWERINISVFLLWVVVLAITLLRVQETATVIGRQDTFAA
jgi:hypothetical protein